jgi:hypothetical protein
VEQKVVIALDAAELQELERILMDQDEKDALRFLRDHVEKKVKDWTAARCKPPHDGG